MASAAYHERNATSQPGIRVSRRHADVTRRLVRLERMATDPLVLADLIADGRYLRLAAAIARASEIVEREHERLSIILAGASARLH